MSFFKRDRDLSAYPQPVLVTPDPKTRENNGDGNGDDIAKEVAEAASTSIHDSDRLAGPTATAATTQAKGKDGADAAANTRFKGGEESTPDSLGSLAQQTSATAQGGEGEGEGGESLQDKDHQDAEAAFQDTQDQMAWTDGIMSVIGPVIQEMDFNIVSVRKSQVELEKEIERLTAELQLFMDSAATPPEVEPAIRKLTMARKQIIAASTTLRTVQDRVDRMCVQVQRKR
ncbi:hypothetical protein DFQ27_004753 [Actinomortierella ambigua]|uniref:Biogenesis of lysosome-related organelles complex 1 subunit 7 n=1 Tax=Actinomortierella ambigua TaxID=1343610 RepID=A0A9P6Q442_9FUNG|nr:hypothetical protein DFQ27_004753 [Actinomortierella ambigua]